MDRYRFQAQLNRISPVGVVPEGLRIDIGFAGTVSDGVLAGGIVEGVDYLLIRPDGIAVIDARERIVGTGTNADAVVAVRADGYVTPPFDLPELATLLDPSFAWPDVDLPLHGAALLRSAAPALATVNSSVYSFTGSVNMARGSLSVDARVIATPDHSAGAQLLARGYESFAAGDLASVLEMFHPDIRWHQLDDNPLTGEYRGRDEVRGYFERLQELSEGTFHLDVREVFSGPDQVVALVTENASVRGSRLTAPAVHVWRLVDGLLAEFTDHHADQLAVDRFWNQS